MIFNKITLYNFGPYYNRQEFDLRPRVKNGELCPVILFGGKNGAGKTTIFEAINLSLYGSSSLGPTITKSSYEEYLSDKIHRNTISNEEINEASVELEFSHVHLGFQNIYQVLRSWKKNGKKIEERLSIKRNGDIINDLDRDQWDTLLKEILPPGIAQTFFFDGEKIRKLSGERSIDRLYMIDSIETLLGIDIINRLKTDLVTYSRKLDKEKDNSSYINKIDELNQKKEDLSKNLKMLKQDRAQSETRISWLKSQISLFEEKVALSGGEFSEKYGKLKSEDEKLKTEINNFEDTLRDICHGVLPFSLCSDLCKILTERIRYEQNELSKQNQHAEIQKHVFKLTEEIIHSEELKSIKTKYINSFCEYMVRASNNILHTTLKSNEPICVINDLSRNDIEKMTSWIHQAINEMPSNVSALCKRIDEAKNNLKKVEANFARIPSEDAIRPLISQLNQVNRELGVISSTAKRQDEDIKKIEFHLNQIDREIKKINQDAIDSTRFTEKLRLLAITQEILVNFESALKKRKIKELEDTISHLFNQLCRKKNLVSRISIDPTNFSHTFYDERDNKIPQKSLSSGERQIFAISLLWSLKKISGRPLPLIIDTPLSRLDSDHRSNLVNIYFPNASHQTLVLSTDTEIDHSFFHDLSRYVSHAYHLNYYEDKKITVGAIGYFWEKDKHDDKRE
jgi:DNA sulfur modification protein DndD